LIVGATLLAVDLSGIPLRASFLTLLILFPLLDSVVIGAVTLVAAWHENHGGLSQPLALLFPLIRVF